ncbi:MAG: hypothetical protein ABH844_05100, partial [Candidatus Omnitrophota bacterium]
SYGIAVSIFALLSAILALLYLFLFSPEILRRLRLLRMTVKHHFAGLLIYYILNKNPMQCKYLRGKGSKKVRKKMKGRLPRGSPGSQLARTKSSSSLRAKRSNLSRNKDKHKNKGTGTCKGLLFSVVPVPIWKLR